MDNNSQTNNLENGNFYNSKNANHNQNYKNIKYQSQQWYEPQQYYHQNKEYFYSVLFSTKKLVLWFLSLFFVSLLIALVALAIILIWFFTSNSFPISGWFTSIKISGFPFITINFESINRKTVYYTTTNLPLSISITYIVLNSIVVVLFTISFIIGVILTVKIRRINHIYNGFFESSYIWFIFGFFTGFISWIISSFIVLFKIKKIKNNCYTNLYNQKNNNTFPNKF